MRTNPVKAIAWSIAAASLALALGGALAQGNYPEQPIRIMVGFTPGTAPDITSRLFADKLTESWGKPVVVENVTGAGGNLAVERLVGVPDGHTLSMGAMRRWSSILT